jgi:hypothetical protein
MAVYKTYTCDYPGCKKLGAMHFEIPNVNHYADPADSRTVLEDGDVDLCVDHVGTLITAALSTFKNSTEQRREYWQRLKGAM